VMKLLLLFMTKLDKNFEKTLSPFCMVIYWVIGIFASFRGLWLINWRFLSLVLAFHRLVAWIGKCKKSVMQPLRLGNFLSARV